MHTLIHMYSSCYVFTVANNRIPGTALERSLYTSKHYLLQHVKIYNS